MGSPRFAPSQEVAAEALEPRLVGLGSEDYVDAARLVLGMSELARRAGISRQHVWRLEHGQQQPSLEVAQRLALALDQDSTVWD